MFARLTIDQRNQILAGGGEAAARLRESQRSSFVGVLEHIIGVPGSRIEQTEDEQMALIEHLIERARRLNEKQFLEVRQQTYDTLSANAGLAELDSARLELVISGYAAMAVLQNPDAGTEASVIDDAA